MSPLLPFTEHDASSPISHLKCPWGGLGAVQIPASCRPPAHPSGMVSLGIALTQMPDLALGLVEPHSFTQTHSSVQCKSL